MWGSSLSTRITKLSTTRDTYSHGAYIKCGRQNKKKKTTNNQIKHIESDGVKWNAENNECKESLGSAVR